jgi:imidazoleglycerol-phosphate dehydratase/histidinol-phosphatase
VNLESLRRIAFIDRDGTIVKEPADFQLDRLEKVEFLPDVIEGLKALMDKGYELVMVSNQDGLGTASFPQKEFDLVHNFIMKVLQTQGVEFKAIEICPHFPADACHCRKPQLGLVTPYLKRLDTDNSFVVGDRESDCLLAEHMGVRCFRLGSDLTWKDIISQVVLAHRSATIERNTNETKIRVETVFDGKGEAAISSGLYFFDHMLEQLARHSGVSIKIECTGDLEVDEHHTVEDVALALGSCLNRALLDRRRIARYAFLLPMDESLAQVALDLGGRPQFVFEGHFPRQQVGDLPTEMVIHFFKSLCDSLRATLHLRVTGENTHHMVEACFKGVARALGDAVRESGGALPSTKGVL